MTTSGEAVWEDSGLRPVSSDRPKAVGFAFFSSDSEEARTRRPTDAVLLVVDLVLLAALIIGAEGSAAAEQALADAAQAMPSLLATAWSVLHDLLIVWAVLLVVVAACARARWGLVRDLLLAGLVACLAAVLAFRLVEGSWPPVLDQLTASSGPSGFPAFRLAVSTAVIVAASPHLARPFRYAGRLVLAGGAIATLCLGVSLPGAVIGGLIIGTAAAAVVHLALGSPGGRPTVAHVAATLAQVDCVVDPAALAPADLSPEGVWVLHGRGDEPIVVKVYGRDALDGQLAMSLWRRLWYRHPGGTLAVTRAQAVEHEAFLTLLAARSGISVPRVLAAGARRGADAVLVLSADSVPLDQVDAPTDALVRDAWRAIGAAHEAGLSPGRLDPTTIGATADDRAVFLEWATGQTAPSEVQRRQDGAQLLISTAIAVGDERAIAVALDALGTEQLEQLLPYLQPAGLSPTLRRAAKERGCDLDDLRDAVAAAIGVELPELVRLRRVTVGSVVQAALLFLAVSALLDGLTSLDFEAVSDELREMAFGPIVASLFLAQVARASGALSTIGASPADLPPGPLVQLQFAISYINMAVPSTAGRLATVARFYQRVGSTAATALGASALDSLANFVVQVSIVVLTLVFSLGSLELDISSAIAELPSGLTRLVVIVTGLTVLAAVVVLLVPSLRKKVAPSISQFRAGLAVLREPSKVAYLLGGNLLTQLLYALAFGACVESTGHDVLLADLLLILALVGTFASLVPVPNGIGVTEAGLTAGLVAAGVPSAPAFAAVLVYRVLSAYLPPVAGFFAMRSLQQRQYL